MIRVLGAASDADARDRMLGSAALGSLVVGPPAVGLLVPAQAHVRGLGPPCALLHATGIPCPACGATRAFVYLMHGDSRWAHYNWMWLVVWAALALVAAQAVYRRSRGRSSLGPALGGAVSLMRARPWVAVALALAMVLACWLVAMANLEWIRAY